MGILDLLFPKKCLGCGRTGAYFCSHCLNLVSQDREEVCPVCERPSIGGFTHPHCRTRFTLDGFTSVFRYQGVVKRAIAKLKYRFVTDLAADLVELFLSFCGENPAFWEVCQRENLHLVPIPLHPQREKWRGFNQAELLGKMIAENLGIGFAPDLLKRIKNTKPQVQLKEKERKNNIKDAFQIAPNSRFPIPDSQFLLFDDVWTTGATLKEAAKTLKKAGGKFVWGLTLAR